MHQKNSNSSIQLGFHIEHRIPVLRLDTRLDSWQSQSTYAVMHSMIKLDETMPSSDSLVSYQSQQKPRKSAKIIRMLFQEV